MTPTSETTRPTAQGKKSTPNRPGGTSSLVEVERTFGAPVERVWEAWSNPELIKQWWGPDPFTCPEAKTDFRVGGNYLFAMRDPDGKTIWGGGIYEEIEPRRKIVYSDAFTDENGTPVSAKEYGMPGEWPIETTVTVEFEKIGGRTRMTLTHEGIPAEMHDDCVRGWSGCFDKMQKLVERS